MHSVSLPRAFRSLLLIAVLSPVTVRADEPPIRDLLRDGLYAEEVSRDPEAAAKHYEQVLARHAEQREFAAAALFRLAEVRRKQDRKDDAVKLYQQLLTEFPAATAQTKLARENLVALGGKEIEPEKAVADPEAEEIARLESLAKNAPDIILDPKTLEEAARNGRSKVVAYLLAAGSRPDTGNALLLATDLGYLEIVKQLTSGDVTIPADVATVAIETAIQRNRYTILDYLLQRGFQPGEMTGKYDSSEGSSALAYALESGSPQCAEILLKHGVDVNATSKQSDSDARLGGTALQYLIAMDKIDAANWLLDKGAKPDIPSLGFGITPLHQAISNRENGSFALIQRLLQAGADPNRRTSDGPNAPFLNATPLLIALSSEFKSIEKIRLLLKHGANPKSDSRLLVQFLNHNNGRDQMELLKLLVEAGAELDDDWIEKNIRNQNAEMRSYLVEKFTIPRLVRDAEIQMLIDDPFGIDSANIAVRSGDHVPPELVSWMLANHQNREWMQNDSSSKTLKYVWCIWRKGSEGILVKQKLNFADKGKIPALQWGDVVHCRIYSPSGGGGYSREKGLPADQLALFRKSIAFPITMEIDGKVREITVRGDRVVFDPTKQEIPLLPLQRIVQYFWDCPIRMEETPIIYVSRKGWPEVRFSYNSLEAGKFDLQAGDRVKLEYPEKMNEALAKARKESAMLKVEGFPYVSWIPTMAEGKFVSAYVPTLMQTLVETQAPWRNSSWKEFAGKQAIDVAEILKDGAFNHFTLLPHPDLANIRIRRLKEDGTEKVIEVDLAKAIAAATDQTTAEEAKKADVMLQLGDVVEISLIKDRLGEPWKGFNAQEEALFTKALSGRVQITDDQGNITLRDLVYQAPRFIETESGWIPVPAESGISALRGSSLTAHGWIDVKRGDVESGFKPAYLVFLRDGDEIRSARSEPARPRQVPPQQPQPQPSR